jgi:hypothetical protein
MDLLDEVLGGKLQRDLGSQTDIRTGRDYHEMIVSGLYLTSIGTDLFVGRLHDKMFNKYDSTSYPDHMREYLQTVLVPGPTGSPVPLADAPAALVERTEPLPAQKKSWFTHVLWGALIALLLGYGASAYRRAATAPQDAAEVIVPAAIASGIVGLIILGFMVLSRVPEFRQNELILVFWPTDLWLAYRARRFLKKGMALDAWVQRYAHARLALAGLAVVGHLVGVLYQKPRILLVLGVVEAAVIWGLVRALRGRTVAAQDAPKAAPAAAAQP